MEIKTRARLAIKAACKKNGIFQYELAKRTGIHRHTLKAIRDGRHDPKLSNIAKIADYFNLTIDEFLALGDVCK
jgi:DNA-binding XRE family transcriptional regulator